MDVADPRQEAWGSNDRGVSHSPPIIPGEAEMSPWGRCQCRVRKLPEACGGSWFGGVASSGSFRTNNRPPTPKDKLGGNGQLPRARAGRSVGWEGPRGIPWHVAAFAAMQNSW